MDHGLGWRGLASPVIVKFAYWYLYHKSERYTVVRRYTCPGRSAHELMANYPQTYPQIRE